MTERQLKYVEARKNGKNKKNSALEAGYGKNNTTYIEKQPTMQRSLKQALENIGVNEGYMASYLRDGMHINKESFVSSKVIPDNDVQQRYAQLVMRARGDIDGETQTTVNLGIIQIPGEMDMDEWNKDEGSKETNA